jgi:Domain of unknown function (DUF4386)
VTGEHARALARVGGVLYLTIIALGIVGEAVIRARIVGGDPAATAINLHTLEWLWRTGVVSEVILLVCATFLSVILYTLLRQVNAELALLVVVLNVVSIAIEGVAAVSLANALSPVTASAYRQALSEGQLAAMATMAIRSHTAGFSVALVFFGFECIVLGYLIYCSAYLPRALGVLMSIAGAGYIVNSVVWLLSPTLSRSVFPLIAGPAFIGELSFALWLLARGIRAERWRPAEAPL